MEYVVGSRSTGVYYDVQVTSQYEKMADGTIKEFDIEYTEPYTTKREALKAARDWLKWYKQSDQPQFADQPKEMVLIKYYCYDDSRTDDSEEIIYIN